MWVYIRSEPGLYTVGHYSPDGKFNPESDWDTTNEAAMRTHFLNGGDEKIEMPGGHLSTA